MSSAPESRSINLTLDGHVISVDADTERSLAWLTGRMFAATARGNIRVQQRREPFLRARTEMPSPVSPTRAAARRHRNSLARHMANIAMRPQLGLLPIIETYAAATAMHVCYRNVSDAGLATMSAAEA